MYSADLIATIRGGTIPFAILSAETADATAASNAQRTQALHKLLLHAQFRPLPVCGVWEGVREQSFLVPHCERHVAEYYGRRFEQNCVIADYGFCYVDGRYHPFIPEATIFFPPAEPPDGAYSIVQCEDGALGIALKEADTANLTIPERISLLRRTLARHSATVAR